MLNKKKCGILYIAGRNGLSQKEDYLESIMGIPITEEYKYLGIVINKTLTPHS